MKIRKLFLASFCHFALVHQLYAYSSTTFQSALVQSSLICYFQNDQDVQSWEWGVTEKGFYTISGTWLTSPKGVAIFLPDLATKEEVLEICRQTIYSKHGNNTRILRYRAADTFIQDFEIKF